MKRTKAGDVYSVQVPNGIKLYQWAYSIPYKGNYIRVFPGLYDSLPDNIEHIAAGEHSFITGFAAGRAYRLGLACLIGSFQVPDKYPFPQYMIGDSIVGGIRVMRTDTLRSQKFDVRCVSELPPEYRDLKMVNGDFTPDWMFYLFDIDFSMEKLNMLYPGLVGVKLDKYTALCEELILASGHKIPWEKEED